VRHPAVDDVRVRDAAVDRVEARLELRPHPAADRGERLLDLVGAGLGDHGVRVRRIAQPPRDVGQEHDLVGPERARHGGRWDDLVDLFTPDGAFVGLATARGHDELRTFFSDLQDGPLSAWWHFSSNETIDLVGTPAHAATGATWLDQPCVVDGRAHVAAGRYQDQMVRSDDGRWRFAERQVSFFYWVPGDEDWAPGRYGWAPARAAADVRTLERVTASHR